MKKTITVVNEDGTNSVMKIPRVINYEEALEKLAKRQQQSIGDLRIFLIEVLKKSGITLPDDGNFVCRGGLFWMKPHGGDQNSWWFEIYSSEEEESMMLKVIVTSKLTCQFGFYKYFSESPSSRSGETYKTELRNENKYAELFSHEWTWITLDEFYSLIEDTAKFFKEEIDRVVFSTLTD